MAGLGEELHLWGLRKSFGGRWPGCGQGAWSPFLKAPVPLRWPALDLLLSQSTLLFPRTSWHSLGSPGTEGPRDQSGRAPS